MTKINLNQSPYFDDSNESKKFHKVLFRPGRAVQARELTQIQSLLQKQVERIGRHIFEQGAQVLPGSKEGVKYINNVGFIKIGRSFFAQDETQLKTYWLGKTIKSTSGSVNITAQVIGFRAPDTINEARLYINYLSAGTDGNADGFSSGQIIVTDEVVPITATIGITPNTSTGFISSVIVEEGVYFFDGNFILVDQQQVFITPPNPDTALAEEWTNKPTALVGLLINESIVTSDDDSSLLDNALGSPNYAAPGADRLAIDAQLVQRKIDNVDTSFITLVKVENGVLFSRVVSTDYSVLEDTLARRTFDESGDYVVRDFPIEIKEFLSEDDNGGVYPESKFHRNTLAEAQALSISEFKYAPPGVGFLHPNTIDYPGKYIPAPNYAEFIKNCRGKLVAKIDQGKAYVKGYEIEKLASNYVHLYKARETNFVNNKTIFTPLGNFVYIITAFGVPDVQNFGLVELHSGVIDPDGTSPYSRVGSARVLACEYFSGVNGTEASVYRLFLFDVQTDAAKTETRTLTVTTSGTTLTSTALLTGSPALKKGAVIRHAGTGQSRTIVSFISDTQAVLDAAFSPNLSSVGVTATIITSGDLNQVKSIYASNPTFTANILREGLSLTGSASKVTIGGTLAATGVLLGIGTRWKNNATERVRAGDYVRVAGGRTSEVMYYVTHSPENDNELKVSPDPQIATWPDGSTVELLYTNVRGNGDESGLIYNLPDDAVATVRSENKITVDSVFISRRVLVDGTTLSPASTANGLGELTVNLLTPNETFQTFSPSDYIVINTDTGDWLQLVPYIDGSIANASAGAIAEVQVVGANLTIHAGSANAEVHFYVVASIIRAGGATSTEKSKILVPGQYVISAGSDVTEISLGHADIYRITKVTQSPDYSTIPVPGTHRDITGLYILDNGQRDYYYDIGKAVLQPGAPRPTGRVRVDFEYFNHSGTGDYFSVDSYPFSDETIDYSDIPMYKNSKGVIYDLASCIDFRPRVSDSGVGFSVTVEPPRDNFRCDYHFYTGRIDKLYLDKSGSFFIKTGTPDTNPAVPSDSITGMTLSQLFIRPYTANITDCVIKLADNRRYTMRDIGKLDRRIKNVEEYTSLNLLEKSTADLVIKDSSGQDKFKNGFLVDNFSSDKVSDVRSNDFKCTIDTTNGEVHPLKYVDNVGLVELASLAANPEVERANPAHPYQKTGDILTLPYTPVILTKQTKASKIANVNPYHVFTYVGVVEITPWSDDWMDINTMLPNNIEDTGAYDLTETAVKSSPHIGSIVQNNWTGIDISNEKTGRQKLIFAGHSDIGKVHKKKDPKQDNSAEPDKKNQTTAAQQSKGSKGSSVHKGPGKPAPAAEKKAGRTVVGGHSGAVGKKGKKK